MNGAMLRQQAALALIASEPCEVSTAGIGSCFANGSGRTATARYGGDKACAPCIAYWGLGLCSDLVLARPGEPE